MRASLRRVWGMMYRHLALFRRSWPRVVEMAYWPILQMLVWGFTARFLGRALGTGPMALAAGALLGGVLLWEVALRSQMGASLTFLEEIWSRNLGHVFVSPLRPAELIAALLGISILRTAIGVLPAILVAWALYAFDLFRLGPVLVLFAANLLVMGWWVSLGVIALILRHGAGAEALAWSLMFGFAPLSAVFYPVAVLPRVVQPIARGLPSAHVFEGMRTALSTGAIAWDQLAWAAGLNVVWLCLAIAVFAGQFQAARVRGALISIGE